MSYAQQSAKQLTQPKPEKTPSEIGPCINGHDEWVFVRKEEDGDGRYRCKYCDATAVRAVGTI